MSAVAKSEANTSAPGSQKETPLTGPHSEAVKDARLQIQMEIRPGTVTDRIPMRTAVLHFRNVSKSPVRIYLPSSEPFRANISTIYLSPPGETPLFVPEPRPHGYVVTEEDFHLLAPGESRSFEQSFSIDPFAPGPGNRVERMKGFEKGKKIAVSWVFENNVTTWKGGVETLDGTTRELFEGKEIPHIWTGKLTVKMEWEVPD